MAGAAYPYVSAFKSVRNSGDESDVSRLHGSQLSPLRVGLTAFTVIIPAE